MTPLFWIAFGFIINTNVFLILTIGKNWNSFNTKSFLTIINSVIISFMCYIYIQNNDYLNIVHTNLYYLMGFCLFDVIYLYYYETRRELYIKIIHHTLASVGTIVFPTIPIMITTLFLTEIINIPLEIRFVAIRNNYKKKAIKPIMEVLIYFLFLIYRIIYPYNDYISVCQNQQISYCISFTLIYMLWIYWFILINIKVYNILDKIGLFNFKIDY